ncbi:hypothetical protein ACV0BM_006535 [Elizabethkingia meningoseptica]|uniref:hypothetical protein n=1 Tax=Elizabethkingia meningoseptica TaxID=238 RepID=UPI002012EE61|nr:hypothetical protein [Elizabethkingia meningoseptica]MCL1676501.1 hypothetical protein [Elizabethkingia meningoseptica]MCL1687435.1 hypothetical protein [Elizabethkingia meningoseptica]
MKYFHSFFIILILLISCNRKENIINNLVRENNISIINLSKETIDGEAVLREYDDSFLKKYGFVFPGIKDKTFDINDVKSLKTKDNKMTKVSQPVFSKNNKYCLIQIIVYNKNIEEFNTTYLLEKNEEKWVIESEMVVFTSP